MSVENESFNDDGNDAVDGADDIEGRVDGFCATLLDSTMSMMTMLLRFLVCVLVSRPVLYKPDGEASLMCKVSSSVCIKHLRGNPSKYVCTLCA